MKRFIILAAALALTAAACTDNAGVPTSTDEGIRAPRSAGERVSYAIALAMSQQTVRDDLLASMRESLVSEHKLVLQEFVATSRGERVARAASQAAGMQFVDFMNLVRSLPALDFYAPFVEHRATWMGDADVVVSFTPDQDAKQVSGYNPAGRILTFSSGTVPAPVMLMLHPAERKEQVLAAPRRSGTTIEVFNEASLSVVPGAISKQIGYGTTTLYQFRFHDSDGWGDAEVEFAACYQASWDNYARSLSYDEPCLYAESGASPAFYRKTGVNKSQLYTPNFALINARAGFNSYVVVSCWEDDSANDDYYGFTTLGHTASYGTWTAGGTMTSYGNPSSWQQRSTKRCEMLFN